jgi:hypothetical protein
MSNDEYVLLKNLVFLNSLYTDELRQKRLEELKRVYIRSIVKHRSDLWCEKRTR